MFMRVVGYLGLLAAIVIICIMGVHLLKSVSSASDLGEQRAVKQINADGDAPIDPNSEMKDTVHDALSR